mmetsp:Transcript_24267/g.34997  ORF Transcript_24267/g.34997 Transcript_24267/m.34997 type:complete len:81 (-) Transcript_24267:284-526(-)
MDELPIDIHYAKLLDWLLDRRKVPSGWHEGIRRSVLGLFRMQEVAERSRRSRRFRTVQGRPGKEVAGYHRNVRERRPVPC